MTTASPRGVLVVGAVPRRFLAENGWTRSPWSMTRCDVAADIAQDRYDVVVANGEFFTLGFLDLAEYLLRLRNSLKTGGTLILIRRPIAFRDRFFIYRNDDFFEQELPKAAQADFAAADVRSWNGYRIVEMKDRVAAPLAAERLAALPVDSLARLFLLAGETPLPWQMWTAPTTRCNLRCLTCSVRGSGPGEDMSDEVIDRIFDTLSHCVEIVNVTGIGEPLFSRTWRHLYQRIREKPGRLLEIVTNGTLLTEEMVRDMMRPEHRTSIVISIDGNSRETFEWIRERAKWDRIVDVMEMIKRVRSEMNPGANFWLAVDFVAIRDNIHELPGLIERAAQWGANGFLIIDMGDWETNREFFREQGIRFYPELANKYFALAREAVPRNGIGFLSCPVDFSDEVIARRAKEETLATPLPRPTLAGRLLRTTIRLAGRTRFTRRLFAATERLLEAWLRNPIGMPRSRRHYLRQQIDMADYETLGDFARIDGFCRVVVDRAFFHTNGDVAPCCGLINTLFGNIRTRPFAETWNSRVYREFRIMNLLGYPHAACYYCTLPYGLPAKNPQNFIEQHSLPPETNRLARRLRTTRAQLAEWGPRNPRF